jgi:hypothetical protein
MNLHDDAPAGRAAPTLTGEPPMKLVPAAVLVLAAAVLATNISVDPDWPRYDHTGEHFLPERPWWQRLHWGPQRYRVGDEEARGDCARIYGGPYAEGVMSCLSSLHGALRYVGTHQTP